MRISYWSSDVCSSDLIVDDVGVVAVTTTQLIRAGSAIKTVAGRVAHNDLIPSIAGALIGSGSFNKDQLLDVFREGIVTMSIDDICALVDKLHYRDRKSVR